MDLKLTIDPIPGDTWGLNLRKALHRRDWEEIRQRTFQAHGTRCSICGYEGKGTEIHEVWDFDYSRRIQSLVDFIPLCKLCHLVKHIMLAWLPGTEGKLDIDKVVRHFLEVNRCTVREFNRHLREPERITEEQGSHFWTVKVKYPGWEWVTFPR